MNKQIPLGDANLDCPLHRKSCAKVCHRCPLWVKIRGTNPNTGEELDDWKCSLAWLPMLLINVAQESRQGAAATESFRNVMVSMAAPRALPSTQPLRAIEG